MNDQIISVLHAHTYGVGLTFLSMGAGDRVDWLQIFIDLKEKKYSIEKISDSVNVPQGTLKGWKSGSRPKFEEALRLIWFWSQATGKNPEHLPMCKASNEENYHPS